MINTKLHVGNKAVLRKVVVLSIALLLIAAIAGSGQLRPAITADNVQAQVFFSPRGGCTEAVVSTISQAKAEILVQAYSFTSAPIAKALVDAHKRGVHVQIILDRSQRKERYSSADFTAHAGIPTYIDAAHAIAHNKVMIIDKATVISGSFNFTKAAEEKNAENLLVLKSKELARGYIENWAMHKEHSERYAGR
jgi:phosphatidylserine/phosphatidylglycerophosphate/cardiolipin synthase-like enzyme